MPNAEFRNAEFRFCQLLYHGQTLVVNPLKTTTGHLMDTDLWMIPGTSTYNPRVRGPGVRGPGIITHAKTVTYHSRESQ